MAQDGPPGLPPRIAKALLDKLETDDSFRAAFSKAPADALRSLGHADGAPCIALKPGATLASKAQIKTDRSKIEGLMVGIQGQDCALDAQQGY